MLNAPGVVLIDPKYPHNVGAAIRACSCFCAEALVCTGSRIQISQYERLPREERMKGYKRVQFLNHQRPLELFGDCTPVCVEVYERTAHAPRAPGERVVHLRTGGRECPSGDPAPLPSVRAHPVALLSKPERSRQRSPCSPADDPAARRQGTVAASPGDAARSPWRGANTCYGCCGMGRKMTTT